MKKPNTKLAAKPSAKPAAKAPTPLFQKTLQRLPGSKPATPPPAKKRDKIFSKSRDNREDRGVRQIKTSRR